MSAYSFRSKWRLIVFQLIITFGIYAFGLYSGKRMFASGTSSNKNTTHPQKVQPKGTSVSALHGEADIRNALAQLLKPLKGKIDREKIHDFIQSLDAESIKTLLEDPTANALLNSQFYLRGALLVHWVQLDTNAASSWVATHEFADKAVAINDVYDAWSKIDPAAAFAALTQIKGSLHANALDAVISNYMEENPAAAIAALHSLPLVQSYNLYPKAFEAWASQDPTAASAAALNLPPGATRNSTLVGIAAAWAQDDPAGAMAWVNTMPAGASKDDALAHVLMDMSSQNPSAIAASLANYNIPPGSNRDQLLYTIATNYAQQDPAGALAWADQNLVGRDFVNATANALQQISATDPAAAAAYLANITDADVMKDAMPKILADWGGQDPEAALAWAQGLPSDNASLRNTAISNVFSSWIASDPVSAGSYIQQNFVSDPSFKTLTGEVASNWAGSDPQGAFTWALNLPTGVNGARINAITTALSALTNADPQTAMQDALTLSGNNQINAETTVISAWANQNPAQAAVALQNLPEGNGLDTATTNVAKSWLTQDPQAASQWINTLPQGPARDDAVTQIISIEGGSDPAAAFNWAVSIGNETTRNAQVVKLVSQWSNQNLTAAAAAAQNALGNLTNLTPAQQNALQKIVNKVGAP